MRKEVQNAIDTLKSLDLSKYPYDDIVNQIGSVGLIGHLGIDFHPGKYIYRARLNENEEHFNSKCQLTYKPQHCNKTCQRASTPRMTMFYGSILPEEFETGDLDEVRIVPTFEAIPWLRDKTTKGVKRITYTRWTVTDDIKLIGILQHGNYYDKSSYTRKLMTDYEASLNQFSENKEETIAFMTFMAGEYAKEVNHSNDYEYIISAVFSEAITKKGFDGVLYPSVRLDGKGFNVALTPQAADTKIQLQVVMECTAYKLFEKTVMDNDYQAILYPNQTHFVLHTVDPEYHAGDLNCLKELGLDSLDSLQ